MSDITDLIPTIIEVTGADGAVETWCFFDYIADDTPDVVTFYALKPGQGQSGKDTFVCRQDIMRDLVEQNPGGIIERILTDAARTASDSLRASRPLGRPRTPKSPHGPKRT